MPKVTRKATRKSTETGTLLHDRLKWYRKIWFKIGSKTEDAYVSTNTGVRFYILAELDLNRTHHGIRWYNWIAYDHRGHRIGKYKTLGDAQVSSQRHYDREVAVVPQKKVEAGRDSDTPRLRIAKHR
jgi:hypothetical protein